MNGEEMSRAVRMERYAVAAEPGRTTGEDATWYVVDRAGAARNRRVGAGPVALREATWLARILNGLEEEDRAVGAERA